MQSFGSGSGPSRTTSWLVCRSCSRKRLLSHQLGKRNAQCAMRGCAPGSRPAASTLEDALAVFATRTGRSRERLKGGARAAVMEPLVEPQVPVFHWLQPLRASGMASVAFLRENLCSMPACPACFAVCLQHGHTPSHACQFSSETKSDFLLPFQKPSQFFLFPLQCDLAVKEAWRLSSFYRRASGPVTGSLQKALSGSRQADPRKRRSSRLL